MAKWTLFAFILSIIVAGVWLFTQFNFKTTQEYVFIVEPGASLKTIATEMHSQNIIPEAPTFVLYTRLIGKAQALRAGEYLFPKDSTFAMMVDKMVRNDVIMHSIRLGEGWTFAQIAAEISAHPEITKTLDWTNPDTILQQMDLSGHHPEGLFYPETYHFPRGFTDAALLKIAYQDMQDYLNHAWDTRAKQLPYKTPYEALIAASIVEKETADMREQGDIAGVIVRRLQRHMLLQVDPTVIYGLGAHYDKPLTKADLQKDTPYNTYLHLGLPPTPIAIPSPSAISAALNPKPGQSLYFVARGDGTHVFSNELEAHNQAVQEYRNLNK